MQKIKLTPGAQRALQKMQPNNWYTATELRTNRQTMNILLRQKIVVRKNQAGNFCHRPEASNIYRLTAHALE